MNRLLKSSKFTAVVVAALGTALVQYLGLDKETADQLVQVIFVGMIGYIGGGAAEDVAAKLNGKGGKK